MSLENYVEFKDFERLIKEQALERSRDFHKLMKKRRSHRHFSNKKIDDEIIKNALKAANLAPSGANKQPWHFAVVTSLELKKKIRLAAEVEEDIFYNHRAGDAWLNDLKPLGTNQNKPFLEEASHLIVVFAKTKEEVDGEVVTNYYPLESTGLATGILVTALHNAGVATLTHTPNPMRFLNELLGFNKFYRPMFLLVAGYPQIPTMVPSISKKKISEVVTYF